MKDTRHQKSALIGFNLHKMFLIGKSVELDLWLPVCRGGWEQMRECLVTGMGFFLGRRNVLEFDHNASYITMNILKATEPHILVCGMGMIYQR